MYDELVKRLRESKNEQCYIGCFGNCGDCKIDAELEQAADAIEELQQTAKHYKGCSDDWYKEACDYKAMLPRWIPVTERLPEKNQIVVAHEGKGTWDFGMFRGISASGNPEYWHWKKNTFKHVKWWMPKDGALPEPPKEET